MRKLRALKLQNRALLQHVDAWVRQRPHTEVVLAREAHARLMIEKYHRETRREAHRRDDWDAIHRGVSVNNLEFQHQAAFVEWARYNEGRYPGLRLAFHCPSGGLRSKATAGKMKALGVRKGVPDWMCPAMSSREGFRGVAVEFKAGKGKLTPEQATYIGLLRDEGWFVEVCYSCDEAMKVVERYFGK